MNIQFSPMKHWQSPNIDGPVNAAELKIRKISVDSRALHFSAQEPSKYLDLADTIHGRIEAPPIPRRPAYEKSPFLRDSYRSAHELESIQQDLAASPDSRSFRVIDADDYRNYHAQIIAHAPDHIPIVQGPFHGPKVKPDNSRSYGYVNVSGKTAAAYERARTHVAVDPKIRSMMLQLEDGCSFRKKPLGGKTDFSGEPSELEITTTTCPLKVSFGSDRFVQWNTKMGLMTERETAGAANMLSPATALAHELTHAYHMKTDSDGSMMRMLTPAGDHYDREELLTVKHERRLAQTLGEGVRVCYRGAPIFMREPTSVVPSRLPALQRAIGAMLLPLATPPTTPTILRWPATRAIRIARFMESNGVVAYAHGVVNSLVADGRISKFVKRRRLQELKFQDDC